MFAALLRTLLKKEIKLKICRSKGEVPKTACQVGMVTQAAVFDKTRCTLKQGKAKTKEFRR